MKHRFTVEVELPAGVTPTDMREYIEEAVGCWRGRMDPECPLFNLNGASVVAREVGVSREPAAGVGPAIKHTPAPWTINTNRHHYRGGPGCIWGPKGPGWGVICELPPYGNTADFAVLVAAPDMLDALHQWQTAERINDLEELENSRQSRDAAIRKALGEVQ